MIARVIGLVIALVASQGIARSQQGAEDTGGQKHSEKAGSGGPANENHGAAPDAQAADDQGGAKHTDGSKKKKHPKARNPAK